MRIDRLKIFDKKGSLLNNFLLYDINIGFTSSYTKSIGAEAYAITEPDGYISEVVVKNAGWEYSADTIPTLTDPILGTTRDLTSAEASINFADVSIFNPNPTNSLSIGSVDIDVSTLYYYPTARFTSAVFTDIVSVGLIETEHLSILMEYTNGLFIRPYDPVYSTLVFKFTDGDPEIKLFELNEDTQIISWTDEIIFDISTYIVNTPIMINIGFKATDEGVYERRLQVVHRINDIDYQIGEIIVNSQAVGKDERYDSLISNFGLPDPKTIPHLFKEADLNEELPDWELLNYKSKHIILEHHKILPYIGTYKALINAIKWLGYEDIKIKEWFKNVKDNQKLSLYVPYEAADRTKTILYFSPEERKNLKKLNELSLIYYITQETGELDEWGNPIVTEVYNYNLNEVLIKLKALKDWLELNIIGVNARIVDISGEGIYFERFSNTIYATQDKGLRTNYSKSLTPIVLDEDTELISGDASMNLSIAELSKTSFNTLSNLKFDDLIQYYWDPSNGAYASEDASIISYYDPSTIFIGPTFKYPMPELYSIQWKSSLEKTESGIIPINFVSSPLFIYGNTIRFYNILDVSALFYDSSANIKVTLEKAFLRDPSIELWNNNISYSIYPNFYINMDASSVKTLNYDASFAILDGSGIIYTREETTYFNTLLNPVYFTADISTYILAQTATTVQTPAQNGYTMESSSGNLYYSSAELSLQIDTSPYLCYAYDPNYNVPLFTIDNYKWTDRNGVVRILEKPYYLDILDGNIRMEKFILEPSSLVGDTSIYRKEEYFINFNYDDQIANEQKITMNVIYTSPVFPLYLYDPSVYYNVGSDDSLVLDNSIYKLNVNYTGNYNIELYGWDGNNILYTNYLRTPYSVWNKSPIILSYLDTSIKTDVSSFHLVKLTANDVSILVANNAYPLFDKLIPLYGLTLEKDIDNKYFIKIPSISYFTDLPEFDSLTRFYNLTERCSSIDVSSGNIYWGPDYQTINAGDIVKLVKVNLGSYSLINEASVYISSSTPLSGVCQATSISNNFIIDSSSAVYVLNETERAIYSAENNFNNQTILIDVSNYEFMENQLVNIIIEDLSTGYRWGSSFRVLDISLNPDPSLYFGNTHTLSGNIPLNVEIDPSKYTLTVKHAWSSFADFNINVNNSIEVDQNLHIYLQDTYFLQHYLDNTFVYLNIPFSHDRVINQWYTSITDSSLIINTFYSYIEAITIDTSTLVILDSYYDPSTYLLNGKNIWTLRNHETDELIFRVFNKSVPYIFNEVGVYDLTLESYDSYGNLNSKVFEGLLNVK